MGVVVVDRMGPNALILYGTLACYGLVSNFFYRQSSPLFHPEYDLLFVRLMKL
jgi:hypothetical protein